MKITTNFIHTITTTHIGFTDNLISLFVFSLIIYEFFAMGRFCDEAISLKSLSGITLHCFSSKNCLKQFRVFTLTPNYQITATKLSKTPLPESFPDYAALHPGYLLLAVISIFLSSRLLLFLGVFPFTLAFYSATIIKNKKRCWYVSLTTKTSSTCCQ